MLKDEYKVYEGKMGKSIDSVAADFASVRAGRANAAVLDRIMVDYYGSPTPLQQIAPSPHRSRSLGDWRPGIATGSPRRLKRPFRTPIWASIPRTTARASASTSPADGGAP